MVTFGKLSVAALVFSSLLAFAGSGGGTEMPDTTVYCSSPVALSPEQATGSPNSSRYTAMAWNGQEYGVLYHDRVNYKFFFRRIFADGTPAAAPVLIANSGAGAYGFNPSIVWNGADYAIAYTVYTGTYFVPYFARVSVAGTFISGPTQLAFVGGSPTANADNPQVAWSGSGYAVVWEDNRNSGTTGYDIYYTMLDATGAVSGALHDLNLYAGLNLDDYSPRIAWSPAASRYMAVWTHTFSAGVYQVYGSAISSAGGVIALANPIAGSGFAALNPDITGTNNGFAAVWTDSRDAGGNGEIYFARFSGWGIKLGSDVRLTNDAVPEDVARIAWNGTEFGAFFPSTAVGSINDIWMARVSAAGAVQGSPLQLTYAGDAFYGNAAFGLRGYLLTYSAYQNSNVTGQNFSVPIGCYGGAYTPGCPESPVAYSISGTSATLGWLPAYDTYSDIAYYQVYRNGTLAGISSAPYFTDTGLSLSGNYQYSFRTVNAGQNFSTGCSNTIYVKTGASLTLTLGKSDPNALLNWTDGGLNSYNIFRGTSPQVMSQIGATPSLTASDANALTNTVSFFYTVDDPGQ